MRYYIFPIALTTILFAHSASAQPLPITVTRIPTPAEQVASSVTVVTAADIERKQQRSLLDVLKDVPGVSIAPSGGPGQIARVFMRGTETNHVLVVIDGVEVNDPSSPDNAFDFAHLTTNNVERIEILRGPQGTLYGSEAIGGVIAITTKRGAGIPRVHTSVEAGSYGTARVSAGASGGVGRFNYSVEAGHLETDGFSAVSTKRGGSEDDGESNTTFSTRVGAKVTEQLDASLAVRYGHSNTQYDDSFPLQDANNKGISDELSVRTAADLNLLDGKWKQQLGVSRMDIDRKNEDSFPRRSDGSRTKVDWVHTAQLFENNTAQLGLETEQETFKSHDNFSNAKADVRNNAIFVQDQFGLWDRFYLSLGGRVDDHDVFGRETTYRIAPAYHIRETDTRLRGSYGTGFKAPSLFEIFDGFYGNPNLKPEKSRGWEAGVDQAFWGERVKAGITYFRNDIRDLIDSDPVTFRAINIGKARTQGVESALNLRPTEGWHILLSHTYTLAEDGNSKLELVRRPRHSFLLDTSYEFTPAIRAGVTVATVGARQDSVFPGRVELGSYTTVGVTGDWRFTDTMTLFGRVENLLDKEYESIYGYGTAGMSGYVGLRSEF